MTIRDIVREILDEESTAAKAAKQAGLVHLGFGRYGPKKGGSATHVSKDGKLKSVGDDTDGGEPEDKPFGGDTGKDADFQGEPPEGSREPDEDEPWRYGPFDVDKDKSGEDVFVEPDKKEPEQSAYDKMGPEARELKLTMDSSEEGYKQQYIPILKNLSKKMKNGTFDEEKAVKLMMYYVSNGAKRYAKDFGGGGATGPSVGGFDKETREEAARAYVEDFKDDWDNKNWDFMESITFNGSKFRRVNIGENKMNEKIEFHTISGNKRFMTKTALPILRKYGAKNVKVLNVAGDFLEIRFPIDSNKLKKLDKELKRKNKTAYGGITEDILRKVIREEIKNIIRKREL